MIPLSENISTFLRGLWSFLTEIPFVVTYDRRSVHNRSIVRAIGTILPLPPAPRVLINLAAWNPELDRFTDKSGCEVVSPKQESSAGYQHQIDELHEELKAIKDKLAVLLEKDSFVKLTRLTVSKKESRIEEDVCKIPIPPPPPPPPPPPMPELNLVTSKPPIVKRPKRNGPRSPGGRPIKPKREQEMDTNDILAEVLKKRFSAIQESSDAESFNASFTDISSPIKSVIC